MLPYPHPIVLILIPNGIPHIPFALYSALYLSRRLLVLRDLILPYP